MKMISVNNKYQSCKLRAWMLTCNLNPITAPGRFFDSKN